MAKEKTEIQLALRRLLITVMKFFFFSPICRNFTSVDGGNLAGRSAGSEGPSIIIISKMFLLLAGRGIIIGSVIRKSWVKSLPYNRSVVLLLILPTQKSLTL